MIKNMFNRWLYQFTVGMFFGAAFISSDALGKTLLFLGVAVGFFLGALKG